MKTGPVQRPTWEWRGVGGGGGVVHLHPHRHWRFKSTLKIPKEANSHRRRFLTTLCLALPWPNVKAGKEKKKKVALFLHLLRRLKLWLSNRTFARRLTQSCWTSCSCVNKSLIHLNSCLPWVKSLVLPSSVTWVWRRHQIIPCIQSFQPKF